MSWNKWQVQEQTIVDHVSGLQFQFEVLPNNEKMLRVMGLYGPVHDVYGNESFMDNREFVFSIDGVHVGSGSVIGRHCKPVKLMKSEDL